jgi:hypothetical protein
MSDHLGHERPFVTCDTSTVPVRRDWVKGGNSRSSSGGPRVDVGANPRPLVQITGKTAAKAARVRLPPGPSAVGSDKCKFGVGEKNHVTHRGRQPRHPRFGPVPQAAPDVQHRVARTAAGGLDPSQWPEGARDDRVTRAPARNGRR